MKHILIVDDDLYIGNMLEEVLRREGYSISRAYSGTEALLVLPSSKPDLILLDLMLPGLSGEELLTKIEDIPVIVVSAKVGINDKVNVLLEGAVDYITKPFEVKELLARIIVQMRKTTYKNLSGVLTFGELTLDTTSHELTVESTIVKITKTEYAIIKLLMQNPNQVIAKSVILERISEDTLDCTDASLKQHISNLRKKMRDTSGKDYINAIWGIGFKLSGE